MIKTKHKLHIDKQVNVNFDIKVEDWKQKN